MWGAAGDEITSIANIVSGKTYYIKGVRSSTTYYLKFSDATGSQSGTESSTTEGAVPITFTAVTGGYNLTTPNGNYIAPGTSNGKINVSSSAIKVSASNQSSKIRLSITSGSNTWSIQKNTSAANFGGYKNTQTDITLIEAASCDKQVTITKGSTANGTFDIDQSNGSYDNCDDNFVVHVSNIVPANNAQYCNGINVTGGNSSVTGPVDGVWTVTYTKGNNITSTITPTYANKTAASISFVNAGTPAPTTTGYFVGDSYTLPNSSNYNCNSKTFVGWSTVEVDETDTKPSSNFYEPGAEVPLAASQTFYAVFATASGGGSSNGSNTLVSKSTSTYYSTGYITGVLNTDATWTTDAFTMVQHKISGSTAVSLSYDEIRVYANHSLTFTPSSGTTITSIVVTAGSDAYATALGGSSISNGTKSVSSSTVTITPTDGTSAITIVNSAQSRLNSIVVNYTTGGGTTYSAYSTDCTTPGCENPEIGTEPQSANYAKNASPVTALSVAATGTGTLTYQWYSNTTASNEGGALINGATNASYTPSVAAVGTKYYYCVVRVQGQDCSTTSSVATINVTQAITGITLNKNNTTLEVGETETLTATIAPNDATEVAEWVSSAPSVATVDQDGVVTAVAAGSATITCKSPTDNTIKGECAVTVTPAPEYKKVTAAPADWSGEYLLVYENSASEAYVWTGVEATNCYATAEISNNKITKPANGVKLTIAAITGGYSIMVNGGTNNGKYIYGTSGSNGVSFSNEAQLNTISVSSGDATITSNTSFMQYNSTADQKRFRYYKSGTTTQQDVQLYRKVATSAVTISNPEHGTITVLNGETPVGSGTSIEGGTVLTISGSSSSDAYRFGTISAYKTGDQSTSVTITNGQLTMPDYPITITADEEELLAVSVTVNDANMGSATVNDGAGPAYGDDQDEFTLVATAEPGYEFVNWTANSDNVAFDDANSASTTAMVGESVTFTANFQLQQCTGLAAPTLDEVTTTYQSATIAWVAVTGSEYYVLNITQGATPVVTDEMIFAPAVSFEKTGLAANTTYHYTVMAAGDGSILCDESNPLLEGNFTTDDYPEAVLTLSEIGGDDYAYDENTHKLNDVVTLPSALKYLGCSNGKVLVGWSSAAIAEPGNKPSVNYWDAGSAYTIASTADKLYAVYATEGEGDPEDVFSEGFSACDGTGGNDGSWSGSIASTTLPTSISSTWTCASGFAAKECIKLGGGSAKGSAVTPSISLTGSGTLTFKAAAWDGNSEGTTLNLSATNATLDKSSVTMSKGEWNTYTVAITNATGSINIKFEAKNSSSNRFFLDEVVVSRPTIAYSGYTTVCEAALPVLDAPTGLTAGTYYEAQTITLSATNEAAIYYSLDGNDPTIDAQHLYSEPFTLSERAITTIKAIAVMSGFENSEVAEAVYNINLPYDFADFFALTKENNKEYAVRGVICSKGSLSGTKLTYDISADGSETNKVTCYKGLKLNKEGFESADDVNLGDNVTVVGTWSTHYTNLNEDNWMLAYAAREEQGYEIVGDLTASSFVVGEAFNPAILANLSVNRIYTSGYKEAVDGVTFTYGEKASWIAEETQLAVTAKLGNVELTTRNFEVSVDANTLVSIALKADEGGYETKKVYYLGDAFVAPTIVATLSNESTIEAVATYVSGFNNANAGVQEITVSYTRGAITEQTSYNITMKKIFDNEDAPHTIAEANEMITAVGTGSASEGYMWVRGIVCGFNGTSNNQYYISDDGTETGKLYVFNGKYFDNVSFDANNKLHVGDVVILKAKIQIYSNTNELVSSVVTYQLREGALAIEDVAMLGIGAEDLAEGGLDVTRNGSNGVITFESGNTSVLTIVDNKLHAANIGDAEVTATMAATNNSSSINFTAASATFNVHVSFAPSAQIAEIGGKFIINNMGDTAVFSRGNLQYQQSTATWRTAENQFDWQGIKNLQMGNPEYTDWVDLFCWSIGEENNYGATSAYNEALYFNKEFVDWGGLFTGDWSTLSINEWTYMLYDRPNADDLWGMALIGDTLGMVLLPEGWTAPSGVTFVAGAMPTTDMWNNDDCLDPTHADEDHWRINKNNMPNNKFTEEEWAILENAGAVFLPYGGRRSGGYGNHTNRENETIIGEYKYTYYENYQGAYWTNTVHNADEGKVYWLPMICKNCDSDHENWGRGSHGWWENGRYGHSVRLVHIIPRQYTVTYDANGATSGSVPTDGSKYLKGAGVTLADKGNLKKAGYTFAGWKFKNQTYQAGDEYIISNVKLDEEVVFVAQWEALPVWATTYTSNLTTSAPNSKVIPEDAVEYDAWKINKGSNISLTVPAGTTALHFHLVAWKGEAGNVTINGACFNESKVIGAVANTGIANNSPFTLEGEGVLGCDFYYSLTPDNAITENTVITFTTSGSNRAVVFGVNAIYPEITLDPASYDFENVRNGQTKQQVFTITPNENVTGTLSASITDDANGKFSVGAIENNQVTVTFDPADASSGTFTAKLLVEAGNASVRANLSGMAIAADAPEIVVNRNAVAFGRVNPNASVSEDVAIGLLNIEGAVNAALSGDNDDKFELSASSFTEDGVLTITPVTTENGIFNATLTLSATDATDVVIPVSITVASKWATMYTSNVTVTTSESKTVSINSANNAAYKKAKTEDATITLPRGTQKLHLHIVAWNGEDGDVTVSGDCFSSSKIISVPDNSDVSGTGGTYTFTEALAISYYHELVLDNVDNNNAMTVTVSKSGSRIVLFGVNQEGGIIEISDDTNASAIEDNANIEVKDGATLTVDADKQIGDLTVEAGGTVSGTKELEVNDLIIKTSLGSISGTEGNENGKSGQIASAVAAAGDVYVEIELTQASQASYGWYAFSLPFKVHALEGVFDKNGNKLTNEVNYAIMAWHGDVRAQGLYGWKKYRGIMDPGVLYIITVADTDYKTLRFKKVADAAIVQTTTNLTISEFAASANSDAGWNGIGNNSLQIMQQGSYSIMQFLDHEANAFKARNKGDVNVMVGSAFFVQYGSGVGSTVMMEAGSDHDISLAPAREEMAVENTMFEIKLVNASTNITEDNLFLTAREDALNEYEAGRDVAKMSMGTAKCAQMYVTAYGSQLCAADFPLVNDQVVYPVEITAPAAGSYKIKTKATDVADIYLTHEGAIIWNLSESAYTIDLTKGVTTGYGLLLKAKMPQTPTGIENGGMLNGANGVQKVIIDENVFIIRGGKMYDVTGKAVK